MVEIFQENFREVSSQELDFATLVGPKNNETLSNIEKSEFLQKIKLTLMDYVSSKHAISGLRVNTKNFDEAYKGQKESLLLCK